MGFLKSILILIPVLFLSGAVTIATVSGQSKLQSSKVETTGTDEMLTLCHATGSKENPYETLIVKNNDVAHQNHPADILPAPAEGCPGPSGQGPNPAPVPEPVTMLLFGGGVAAAGYAARRSKRRN